jgi:hypothetical protein
MSGDEIAKGVAAGRHVPVSDPLAAERAAADRLAAASGYTPGQPINDLYRQKTYQALINRGEPHAEAKRKAEFWSRLKAADPENVWGPGDSVDDMLASHRAKQGEGGSSYSSNVWAASSGLPTGSPPITLETPPRWIGAIGITNIEIDRYATNPVVDLYRQSMPDAQFVGPPPQMFLNGDLPPITGSGVDPQVLRWVPWSWRHSAAYTESRGRLLQYIEEADTGGSADLQTDGGAAALANYIGAVQTWAATLPPEPELTVEDIKNLYASGQAEE